MNKDEFAEFCCVECHNKECRFWFNRPDDPAGMDEWGFCGLKAILIDKDGCKKYESKKK